MPYVKPVGRLNARSAARQRVGRIAVELFLHRGFEITTVDQIAEAAGISRRTFFRYFATKEEAVFAWVDDMGLDLAKIVTDRPSGEPVFTVLRTALQYLVAYAEQDVERIRKLKALTNPGGLFPHLGSSKQDRWLEDLTTALTRRFAEMDIDAARLCVTIAFSAYDWAMSRWLAEPTSGDLGSFLDEAFHIIHLGFSPVDPTHR